MPPLRPPIPRSIHINIPFTPLPRPRSQAQSKPNPQPFQPTQPIQRIHTHPLPLAHRQTRQNLQPLHRLQQHHPPTPTSPSSPTTTPFPKSSTVVFERGGGRAYSVASASAGGGGGTDGEGEERRERLYSFEEVRALSERPERGRIVVDVREPTELAQTGRIPHAYSLPLISNPDAFALSAADFHSRFGFAKPKSARASEGQIDQVAAATSSSSSASSSSSSSAAAPAAGKAADEGKSNPAQQYEEGERDEEEDEEEEEGGGGGEEINEVIFYCKAGVRSRTAARLAKGWGVRVGDMRGGWMEWERRGGEVER